MTVTELWLFTEYMKEHGRRERAEEELRLLRKLVAPPTKDELLRYNLKARRRI